MPRVLCCFVFALATSAGLAAESDALTFETHIRPILKAHCWQCHGEDEKLEGHFDARLAQFLLKGGDSGPAIVAGKHAESLLFQRIAAGEMPPGNKKLSEKERQLLARWIDAGAKTARPEPEALAAGDVFTEEERSHWAFQPVRRVGVPALASLHELPDGGNPIIRSPLDFFLLSRLESHRLDYAPEADRATLIRRLTFDLTGLPPTPEDVERFVNDPSPDTYERLVEELLASPHYGERWGRHWLDVAGYADSDGYSEKDLERKWAYRYRDYVIR